MLILCGILAHQIIIVIIIIIIITTTFAIIIFITAVYVILRRKVRHSLTKPVVFTASPKTLYTAYTKYYCLFVLEYTEQGVDSAVLKFRIICL